MEGHHGNLEADAHQKEAQAQKDQGSTASGSTNGQAFRDIQRPRYGINDGHAEGEKGAGHCAQDEVFHPCFVRPWISFADGDEHIKGNGENLQSQEEGQPVDRTRYKNHPQGCKENEPVKLIPGEISEHGVLVAEKESKTGDHNDQEGKESTITLHLQHS